MNEAKEKYLTKSVDTMGLDSRESDSEAHQITYKIEPTDDADEFAVDDAIIMDKVKTDESDFATVFCEEFIPDCDIKMQMTCEETPIPECTNQFETLTDSVVATSAIVQRVNTRRKSERMITTKRPPVDSMDADLICEFCGKLFSSFKEAQIHYIKEHSTPGGNSEISGKRVKR